MLKNYVLILLTAVTFTAKAQNGYNFSRIDFGLAGSANFVFGDAETIKATPSGSVSLNFNPASPFVNYIAEVQFGRLAGGDSVRNVSGRQFKNNFTAYIIRAQVQAGEFIDYSHSPMLNVLKNVYLSAGAGLVSNSISEISRTTAEERGYPSPGKNNSTEFFVPLRAGYELKIYNAYNEPTLKIDLAYQWNLMYEDNLDGIDAGRRKDIWGQVSLGVKIAIGSSTSYRKPITFD
ncbi:hypothetical protein EOD41_14185 [Mucilaginibacter limnophilus]|uniref:Outer membrane protein beta-barrel domain-containing protein n=1 Tax=Mucilaginibacter limnophilus TaxID=1932778 RepID=A0A3S2XZT5_9SPHI|nr:hypothetical protein [Mucilaginibacter limnophilus]RVU00105.1 hypothetical protein EOD41_14185 [Mucilaginibacter limnophilus]